MVSPGISPGTAPRTDGSPRRPWRGWLPIALVLAVTLGAGTVPQAGAAHDVVATRGGSSLNLGNSAPGAPAAERGEAGGGRVLEVGTQFHGAWTSYSDAERRRTLDKLKAMGARWVRLDVSWAALQPRNGRSVDRGWGVPFYDKIISMAHRRGLKVLGMLWLTPSWARPSAGERSAPANPWHYARGLAWAARRWEGKVQAWEVWNEPNSSDFFRSESPREYVRMLCAAHRAVQLSGHPAAVVFGGTVHNDVAWIRRAYDAGAKGCFDAMATHPYTGPANAGPNTGGADDPWDFNRLRAVHRLMVSRGDRKAIWATEFGWSSHANNGREASWNRGVTPQQQARFTVEALRTLRREHPYVTRAFVYNEREKETRDRHQNGYGIMRADLTPKPVYRALKSFLN